MTRDWQEAIARGDIAELAALLADGADIDARDKHGQTAVMLAAAAGDARVVEFLAVHGADLDHTAKYGLSAVMLAALRGHAAVVGVLVGAGANLELRGTGAPGFAGQTAFDLAVARGDEVSAGWLAPPRRDDVAPAPSFTAMATWEEAAAVAGFTPRQPRDTLGLALRGLRVFVRDHRHRDVPRHLRTIEAHYDGLAVCQSSPGPSVATRQALHTSYGPHPITLDVGGHAARGYPLGPEVPPDDIDGRAPAVVTWCDGRRFFFLTGSARPLDDLRRVAASFYGDR